MEISAETKIAALLKESPKALDAIVSINAHFKKLQNPFLRKLMASRVSIADAAKVGGVSLEAFYVKLLPLGFTLKNQPRQDQPKNESDPERKELRHDVVLDVRSELDGGGDPFAMIMKSVKKLKTWETLLLINSFVPVPLIRILEEKGLKIEVVEESPNLVKTYIYKTSESFVKENGIETKQGGQQHETMASLKKSFAKHIKVIDVKSLEMPGPMLRILEELRDLPGHYALHVLHRRVPIYLLPEIEDLGYEACIEEKAADEVELLIFKKNP